MTASSASAGFSLESASVLRWSCLNTSAAAPPFVVASERRLASVAALCVKVFADVPLTSSTAASPNASPRATPTEAVSPRAAAFSDGLVHRPLDPVGEPADKTRSSRYRRSASCGRRPACVLSFAPQIRLAPSHVASQRPPCKRRRTSMSPFATVSPPQSHARRSRYHVRSAWTRAPRTRHGRPKRIHRPRSRRRPGPEQRRAARRLLRGTAVLRGCAARV